MVKEAGVEATPKVGSQKGPLAGVRAVELGGIGPAPFACMLLADYGCEVVRIQRPGSTIWPENVGPDPFDWGRLTVELDLKAAGSIKAVLELIESADVVVEGLRPGVAERLGVGPDPCLAKNPSLVYARMTGWGQDGPLSTVAGHDLNYIAHSGLLSLIGPKDGPPTIPLNLVSDFGGGGMLLITAVLSGVISARETGCGQIIDVAMVDGASLLGTAFFAMECAGKLEGERSSNLLDGGAPFYAVYETADGRFVAVAALEPEFYADLLEVVEISHLASIPQYDRSRWPEIRETLSIAFRTRSQAEWVARAQGTDSCLTPVLSLVESRISEHAKARTSFLPSGLPAPAPRFGRTPAARRESTALSIHDAVSRWRPRRAGANGAAAPSDAAVSRATGALDEVNAVQGAPR